MADDLKRRAPEDGQKINIHQSWELEDWSRKLGISKSRLEAAVMIAGPMVSDVKKFLGIK